MFKKALESLINRYNYNKLKSHGIFNFSVQSFRKFSFEVPGKIDNQKKNFFG
jgi:hypothetical protein